MSKHSSTRERDRISAEAGRLYPKMLNRRMAEKLVSGECLDVAAIGTREESGDWLITGRTAQQISDDALDYCVAETESWIWSIGLFADGKVRASTTGKYYGGGGDNVRCLWLR